MNIFVDYLFLYDVICFNRLLCIYGFSCKSDTLLVTDKRALFEALVKKREDWDEGFDVAVHGSQQFKPLFSMTLFHGMHLVLWEAFQVLHSRFFIIFELIDLKLLQVMSKIGIFLIL